MIDRRLLLAGAGALAALAGLRWLTGSDVEAAGSFEIEKSDAEWRRLLTKQQYEVLRLHRTESPGSSPLDSEKRKGTFSCAGCEPGAVLLGDEVRQQDRVAELLPAVAECDRHRHRLCPAGAAHRGALPPLRRTSRPRVPGWTAADGPALLHQRGRAVVCSRRSGVRRILSHHARRWRLCPRPSWERAHGRSAKS